MRGSTPPGRQSGAAKVVTPWAARAPSLINLTSQAGPLTRPATASLGRGTRGDRRIGSPARDKALYRIGVDCRQQRIVDRRGDQAQIRQDLAGFNRRRV